MAKLNTSALNTSIFDLRPKKTSGAIYPRVPYACPSPGTSGEFPDTISERQKSTNLTCTSFKFPTFEKAFVVTTIL